MLAAVVLFMVSLMVTILLYLHNRERRKHIQKIRLQSAPRLFMVISY